MSVMWVVLAIVFAAIIWLTLSMLLPAFYEGLLVSPHKGEPEFDRRMKRSMRTFAAIAAVMVLVIFLGIRATN